MRARDPKSGRFKHMPKIEGRRAAPSISGSGFRTFDRRGAPVQARNARGQFKHVPNMNRRAARGIAGKGFVNVAKRGDALTRHEQARARAAAAAGRPVSPVQVHVRQTGDWQKARVAMMSLQQRFKRACDIAVQQEAHYYRREVIRTIDTSGRNAGVSWPPLKPLTIMFKRGKSKPLIDRGDLRNAIVVQKKGRTTFVGVPANVLNRDGTRLASIAAVHEFGKVIVVPITPKMLRFLHARLRQVKSVRVGGTGTLRVGGVLVIRIPERSFMRSTFQKLYSNNPAVVRRRVMQRVMHELGPPWNQMAGRMEG